MVAWNTCTSSCIFSPVRAMRAYWRRKFSSTSARLSRLPWRLVLRVMQAEWLKTPIRPCSLSTLALLFCTRSDTPRTRSLVLQEHTTSWRSAHPKKNLVVMSLNCFKNVDSFESQCWLWLTNIPAHTDTLNISWFMQVIVMWKFMCVTFWCIQWGLHHSIAVP